MKAETKKIILTILNIGIVIANLLIKELGGGDVDVVTPLACVGIAFAVIA